MYHLTRRPLKSITTRMREIQESITIAAPPSQVWSVLMDLESWPKWNTFVTSIQLQPPHTKLAVGSRQTITIEKTQTCTNIVSVMQPEEELRWSGSILTPIIFDTEHWCRLEAVEDGRSTRFTQGERFSGILAPIAAAAGKLNELQEGYVRMNRDLKKQVKDIRPMASAALSNEGI